MPKRIQVPGRFWSTPGGIDPGPSGEYAIDMNAGGVESGVFRLASAIPGMVNSKVGLVSLWGYYSVAQSAIQLLFNIDPSNAQNSVIAMNTDSQRRIAINAATTGNFIFQSSLALSATAAWHHFLVAWDTAQNAIYLYIDDVDWHTSATIFVTTDEIIQYETADTKVIFGGSDLVGAPWKECLSQIWFDSNQFLDITIEANRRKFISDAGAPIALGASGENPTGTSPLVYLDNPVASFLTNRGTGGDFTEFGTLADCADNPAGV